MKEAVVRYHFGTETEKREPFEVLSGPFCMILEHGIGASEESRKLVQGNVFGVVIGHSGVPVTAEKRQGPVQMGYMELAERYCLMLGLKDVEESDIESIATAMEYMERIQSP